jgi:hypothetical protein
MTGAFLKSNQGVLTVWCSNGDMVTVASDHVNYNAILDKVKAGDFGGLEDLLNVGRAIASYTYGKVTVKDGQVFYGTYEVKNALVDRILAGMSAGAGHERYIKFLDKLLDNPSSRSLELAYNFIAHNCLRIGADGDVYAFKALREDFKDIHSGTIDNSVGKRIVMPRNQISDDPKLHCHRGLHCGAIGYVQSFGSNRVIVKVNPKDIVCVPDDYNCQKCRVCEYEVVGQCDYDGNPVGDFTWDSVGAELQGNPNERSHSTPTAWDEDREDEAGACSQPTKIQYDSDDSEADEDDDDDQEFCDECGAYADDCDGTCQDEDEDDEDVDDDEDDYCRECDAVLEPDGSCPYCDDEEDGYCRDCDDYVDSNGDCCCDDEEDEVVEPPHPAEAARTSYYPDDGTKVPEPPAKSWWRKIISG